MARKIARKILYSPGFGAGFTSCMHDEAMKAYAIDYQPFIDALENGESLSDGHPAAVQFAADCEKFFGETPYLGGLQDLEVATVHGRVRITEYDGSESYEEEGEYEGWL